MNWTTFLTGCAQIAIATMVLRFCADMVRGAVTGKAWQAGTSVRDLVAKARARFAAEREDATLLDTPTPATEVIPAVDVTPAANGVGSRRA